MKAGFSFGCSLILLLDCSAPRTVQTPDADYLVGRPPGENWREVSDDHGALVAFEIADDPARPRVTVFRQKAASPEILRMLDSPGSPAEREPVLKGRMGEWSVYLVRNPRYNVRVYLLTTETEVYTILYNAANAAGFVRGSQDVHKFVRELKVYRGS